MKIKHAQTGRPRRAVNPGSKPVLNTYYGNRGRAEEAPKKPKFKRPRSLNKLAVKTLDYIFFIVIFGWLIYSLLTATPAHVQVSTTVYHPESKYQEYIDSRLSQLKDRNKISFDSDGLIADIKAQFPEAQTVSVELPILSQKPVIKLDVGQPAFYVNSRGQDYLISANGVAVGYKNNYGDVGDLVSISDQSGFNVQVGRPILSQNDVSFLQSIILEIKAKNVPIKNLVLPSRAEEVDLYTTDAGYYTKFFTGGDAAAQAGQYLAARNAFKTSGPPQQYLDVRVAGKIFYK